MLQYELPATLPGVCPFGWLKLDCSPARDVIIGLARRWRDTLLEYLVGKVRCRIELVARYQQNVAAVVQRCTMSRKDDVLSPPDEPSGRAGTGAGVADKTASLVAPTRPPPPSSSRAGAVKTQPPAGRSVDSSNGQSFAVSDQPLRRPSLRLVVTRLSAVDLVLLHATVRDVKAHADVLDAAFDPLKATLDVLARKNVAVPVDIAPRLQSVSQSWRDTKKRLLALGDTVQLQVDEAIADVKNRASEVATFIDESIVPGTGRIYRRLPLEHVAIPTQSDRLVAMQRAAYRRIYESRLILTRSKIRFKKSTAPKRFLGSHERR